MKFLADENFPGSSVKKLANLRHDIVWLRDAAPGMRDEDILAWAAKEGRIILTFDKDFGEIARNAPSLPEAFGVILFRTPMSPPNEAGERLAAIVTARDDWAGHFSVVETFRIRMRRLPIS